MSTLTEAPANPVSLSGTIARKLPPPLLVALAVMLAVAVLAVIVIAARTGQHVHTGAMFLDGPDMYYA